MNSLAQEQKSYVELSKFIKWSFMIGPVLYDKAKLDSQYGNYSFTNKPIWGYNAGLGYEFNTDKRWGLITGLFISIEPVYHIKYKIKKEDLYSNFLEDDEDIAKMYSIVSFSSPLLLRLNIKADKKLFINFSSGIRAMYFPYGSAGYSLVYYNEDQSESREMFGMNMESPENSIQGSYIIGNGLSMPLNKILFKTNIIYVMNFQNLIKGEYQFGNLLSSPPSRGYYKLSGNYLGLLFSVSLKKQKQQQ